MNFEEARQFTKEAAKSGSILGLESIRRLMAELGNVQDELPVIHITGTNGKGSVGAYLASIFQEAGLCVGRYCSPAVFTPLEVWQYDGRNMTEDEYASTMSQVKDACDIMVSKGWAHPTVFEIETAAAFVYFAAKKPDVVLLEVGMGGETDATNVINRPLASVFATISRDHMQFLGESLAEIASVKAGIMKEGCPVFSTWQEPAVEEVLLARAKKLHCPISFVKREQVHIVSQKPGRMEFTFSSARVAYGFLKGIFDAGSDERIGENVHGGTDESVNGNADGKTDESGNENTDNRIAAAIAESCEEAADRTSTGNTGITYVTRLAGSYQARNASLALLVARNILVAIMERSGVSGSTAPIDIEQVLVKGIARTVWPGRFEVLGEHPLFILDGAHNEDAAKMLAETVQNCFTNAKLTYIIGVLADKEHEKMLQIMLQFAEQVFTVTPENPRAMDGAKLCAEAMQYHGHVAYCASIGEALDRASAYAVAHGTPVLAFGSLSYLGSLRREYESRQLGE